MRDIRSQRAIRVKLDALDKIEKKQQEKVKEERLRKEKVNFKEQVKEMKRMQRRQVGFYFSDFVHCLIWFTKPLVVVARLSQMHVHVENENL